MNGSVPVCFYLPLETYHIHLSSITMTQQVTKIFKFGVREIAKTKKGMPKHTGSRYWSRVPTVMVSCQ
jgi:hypothetical protein